MTFTDKIAHYIQENELNYKNLVIVLPSERAKKYLAKSLFELENKPILAPKMITMDAWIHSTVHEAIIDKTRLLIELFDIQKGTATTQEDYSFDEFLEWGPILLSDFDELDRYLTNVDTIFKDLHNIKELEYWKIDSEEGFVVSPTRQRFLEFWDRLPGYYHQLQQRLTAKGQLYMGGAYKKVSDNIQLVFEANKEATFLFAGFNAWSAAEASIVKQLKKLGRGHVLVDADAFYIDDKNHEAGSFIRKQFEKLDVKTLPFVDNQLLTKSMKIVVIECAQSTGQIKAAASYLKNRTESEINETAIVLADESLIGPLLRNIPSNVGKANITLGLPLKNTAVKNWMDILFSIQETKRRYQTQSLYHNDLNRLLNHPFMVSALTKEEEVLVQQLEEKIIQRNWIFIGLKSLGLTERLQAIVSLVNTPWNNDWSKAMTVIRELNKLVFKEFQKDHDYEKAMIHSLDVALIDFQNIVEEGLPEMSLKSFKNLLGQHWSNKGIAYIGNPTSGLQIMGLLETRLLDFKNIICLGMNEGTMPPTNPIQSMFPMDLRRYAGLPLPRDKQGLFAHHFYRLLHHCEHLVVTYSGTKESLSSSERSRYLLQLEKELIRQNTAIDWSFKYYEIEKAEDKHVDLRSVEKDEAIIQKMDELFAKSTSVSTLNKFYQCPLDFYFRYILEFGEEDSVEEELESSTFGTILHEVLEVLYMPHAKFDREGELNPGGGQPLTKTDIERMLFMSDSLIEQGFLNHFNEDRNAFSTGKNFLSFTMAKSMLTDFLQAEKKFIEAPNRVIIHSLEQKIKVPLTLTIHGEKKNILLNGTIDRIDEVNGEIRLVDYKTGACKVEDVTYKAESKRSSKLEWELNMEVKHLMQLMMYSYLYYRTHGVYPSSSGIFSMVRINNGFFKLITGEHSMESLTERFPTWLEGVFEQIYDLETPFEHKMKGQFSYCIYCK